MQANALDTGRVVAVHGRHAFIETSQGQRLLCHARGKKSDVVVGDAVAWQTAGDEGVIEEVLPRRNLLFRQDEWRTKSFAANLDQLLVLVAAEPVFSESQLARALIAAHSAGIPTIVGLNKTDLTEAAAVARARLAPYVAMGVNVIELALKADPAGSKACLTPLLQGKHTLLLGPSGMGKSSMINLIVPQAEAQVGEISKALNAGRHTTTSTRWYWVDEAKTSALIDSPGFQEFGLKHLTPDALPTHMPDLHTHMGQCRFYNCTHQHEPGCGVRAAVESGAISASRYRIYGEILAELKTVRW